MCFNMNSNHSLVLFVTASTQAQIDRITTHRPYARVYDFRLESHLVAAFQELIFYC